MSWTDDRVETLKRMWGEGQSASQIAKELGGVTRNAVIGKVHPQGVPAMALLESEGFRPNGLVDIFDAGPTVACGRDNIRTVRDARRLTVQIVEGVEAELPALISTDSVAAFRAVRAKADIDGDAIRLTAETAAALKVRSGDPVRVKS